MSRQRELRGVIELIFFDLCFILIAMDSDSAPEFCNTTHFLDLQQGRVFNNSLNSYYFKEVSAELNGPTIIHKGQTYLIGAGCPNYNRCFIINSIDFSSTELPSLIQGRRKHGLVIHSNEIFAIGGVHNDFLSSVESFNGVEWKESSNLINERSDPTCCSVHGMIYVIGGYSLKMDSIERFDGNRWQEIQLNIPILYKRIGWFVLEDWIYLIGGNLMTFRTNTNTRKCFRFNTKSLILESIEDLPEPDCFDFNFIPEYRRMILIGNKNCWEYEIDTSVWRKFNIRMNCKDCLSDCGTTDGLCRKSKKLQMIKLFTKLRHLSKIN
jgi:hypothetical protein